MGQQLFRVSRGVASGYSSGLPGPAPQNVQLLTQGQDAPGDNQGLGTGGHGPGAISQPNHQSIGFHSIAGASLYTIYRSVTTVFGSNGLYLPYATITPGLAAANYASYLASCTNAFSGSPFDPGPGIDCVYNDPAATTCVDSNDTIGPTSGKYYGPTIGYTYKVTATVNGVESVKSVDSIAIFMGGGAWVMCGGIFNPPPVVTKAAAAPAISPLGFSLATFFTLGNNIPLIPATQAYVNPFTGSGCPWGNLGVKGFNFYNVSIYPVSFINGDLQVSTEIANDLFIYGTVVPAMNTTPGQWTTFKFALSSYLNSNFGSGGSLDPSALGVTQESFYKSTWNNGASTNQNMSFYIESSFSVN